MTDRQTLTATVIAYLQAAEARDLAAATEMLAPGAEIVFPGGVRHEDLDAVVTAARERYRSVSKTFETTDVDVENGTVVVTGRLSGENLHGVRFSGVRYIDRFVLRDGLIHQQHVWNDLEESTVLEARDEAAIPPALRADAVNAAG